MTSASTPISENPVSPPSEQRWQRFRQLLFGDPDVSTYAILDAAAIPNLLDRLADMPEESVCLYRGELGPDLLATAPYLVKLRLEGPLLRWLWEEGWGKSWGIYVVSTLGLEPIRRHFRGFLRVRSADGAVLYFRYYDPRVLRIYLPTCTSAEIRIVYGSIQRFLCEAEEPGQLVEFPAHRVRITPQVVTL